MSTVKISELTALSSADAADEFVVVDDSAGVTKKITHANLANFGTLVTASAGITFGADTLDDYEEGTFTPVITDGTTNWSGTGSYVKTGNTLTIAMDFGSPPAALYGSSSVVYLNASTLPIRPVATFYSPISPFDVEAPGSSQGVWGIRFTASGGAVENQLRWFEDNSSAVNLIGTNLNVGSFISHMVTYIVS